MQNKIIIKAWYKKLGMLCDVAAINFYYGNVVLKATNKRQKEAFTEINKDLHIENMNDRISVSMDKIELLQPISVCKDLAENIHEEDIFTIITENSEEKYVKITICGITSM